MFDIQLNVNVQPKLRARGFGNRVFTPKKTANNQSILQWHFKEYMINRLMIPKGIPIEVSAEIRVTHNSGDIDNVIKQIFDSANKILWHDDKQVVSLFDVTLKRKCKHPKLVLKVKPLENILQECEG